MGMVQDTISIAMTTPVCSVCIANYNGEALLPDCIDSVLRQDCDFDVEIIVHDDASDDASVNLLRGKYPQVKIIESTENVGFCIANNRMAESAKGDYLLLLNNDAALHTDALRSLFSKAGTIGKQAILSLPQYDWETDMLVDRGMLLDPFYNPVPNLDPDRNELAYVIGACLWIPRNLWNELQGFPEWMGSIAEDMYLCCVARLYGNSVEVLRHSGYRHRQGASFGGNRLNAEGLRTTYRRRYLSERNKTAVMLICTPTPAAWALLSGHLFALGLEGLLISLMKLDLTCLKAIYGRAIFWILKNSRILARKRRTIQISKKIGLREYLRPHTWKLIKLSLLLRHGIPQIK